ncbi:oxoglutarate-dependent flavonoid 7-O-demethylase 1-like [Silene latifolia]|uniref:oxoglutarate-dependent flavonoid 7-O-demethylase 1-like n=1 Tax=Silene latifolia TaxID=37657 RepID=UPI003D787FC7
MTKTEEKEVNFGKSIIVPSVVELAKQPITNLPLRYVRHSPIDAHSPLLPLPVIDLHKLLSQTPSLASVELLNLHSACKDWGFFQVINHGVSTSLMETFKTEVIKLFELPIEEKKKLWQQSDNHEGFGQLFVMSEEQKLDWSDMFYITTLPPKLRRTELFHKLPSQIREAMEEYIAATKTLAVTLLHQMAKALGIDSTEMEELFSEGLQSIRMNYYPPCPEPDKAIGFAPHSDADALTIVFQLNQTQGLEIRKDGNWVPVIPLENAFIVNIGDIMEIVSNGVYRSVEHRATVNSTKERLSVATFYSSNFDSELGPAKSIIGPANPPVFRTELAELYHKGFFARKLSGKSYLQEMRL